MHEAADYFYWLEFATHGSIHIPWFAYLKDAVQCGKDTNEAI